MAAYVSIGTEPDTEVLRAALRRRGQRVLLPCQQPDGSLLFALDDGALVPGRGGVPEPTGPATPIDEAQVLLVPALAVDGRGIRLGRGGGSYDRLLAGLTTPTLALLHPGELLRRVPAAPHDQAVSEALLPGGRVRLAGRG